MKINDELMAAWNEQFDPKPVSINATPYRWKDPSKIPTRKWLHDNHLIRQFLSVTIAGGGTGKSSHSIVEALELVTGKSLITNHNKPPVRVWYWNGEDPDEEFQRRLQAACLFYGITEADIGGRLFADSGRKVPITVARLEQGRLNVAVPVIDAIKAEISTKQIDVMFVDPFVRCHRVPENDNGMINAVAEAWASIADATNSAIEALHHIRKTIGEVGVEDGRGAVALHDASRVMRVLNGMTKDEGEQAGVENHKLFFRVNDGKANLAPRAEQSQWRELKSVSLGNHPSEPDWIGVATLWRWPDPFEEVTVEDLREVQKRLALGDYRADTRSKDWAGYMVADVLGWSSDDASVRKQLKALIDNWCKTDAIRVSEERGENRIKRKFLRKGMPV